MASNAYTFKMYTVVLCNYYLVCNTDSYKYNIKGNCRIEEWQCTCIHGSVCDVASAVPSPHQPRCTSVQLLEVCTTTQASNSSLLLHNITPLSKFRLYSLVYTCRWCARSPPTGCWMHTLHALCCCHHTCNTASRRGSAAPPCITWTQPCACHRSTHTQSRTGGSL